MRLDINSRYCPLHYERSLYKKQSKWVPDPKGGLNLRTGGGVRDIRRDCRGRSGAV